MTAKWKIGTKMTLWFMLSVSVIVSLLFGVLYGAMAIALAQRLRDDLALAVEQIGAQVEWEGDRIAYENETPIAQEIAYHIMGENGDLLFCDGQEMSAFDELPAAQGAYTRAELNGEPWLLLDAPAVWIGSERVYVRAAVSGAEARHTLRTMSLIFAVGLPLTAGIAALAGNALTRRMLKPIRRIIACAHEISEGNFTQRVPDAPSQDELGELTDTLNRMLAAQEASIRRERQFTSDASHELRTPVAVMLATAENMQAQADGDAQRLKGIDSILLECRRMQRIIEQMLTLTRAQEGRYQLLKEEFSLADVIEGVREALAGAMAQKGILFESHVPEEVVLYADQSLMTQLALNLMENAVKYGKQGGRIVCEAKRRSHQCELYIRDDGIGIGEDELPRVFDRFYRADAARDRSGTGLGLSIVRWIVEAHHGRISIQSAKGRGTTVAVILPDQL